jgi:hypothetical protein
MCPFVDKSDARCAAHMTLQNVVQAFLHCANRYTECSVYSQLTAHGAQPDQPAAALAVS